MAGNRKRKGEEKSSRTKRTKARRRGPLLIEENIGFAPVADQLPGVPLGGESYLQNRADHILQGQGHPSVCPNWTCSNNVFLRHRFCLRCGTDLSPLGHPQPADISQVGPGNDEADAFERRMVWRTQGNVCSRCKHSYYKIHMPEDRICTKENCGGKIIQMLENVDSSQAHGHPMIQQPDVAPMVVMVCPVCNSSVFSSDGICMICTPVVEDLLGSDQIPQLQQENIDSSQMHGHPMVQQPDVAPMVLCPVCNSSVFSSDGICMICSLVEDLSLLGTDQIPLLQQENPEQDSPLAGSSSQMHIPDNTGQFIASPASQLPPQYQQQQANPSLQFCDVPGPHPPPQPHRQPPPQQHPQPPAPVHRQPIPEDGMCPACRVNRAMRMFGPGRHDCLCDDCFSRGIQCPVCGIRK